MDRKGYFHCAKLSLFNARLLADLENVRSRTPVVEQLIRARADKDGVSLPINLMHQSTFLGHAYVVLVWLHEYLYMGFAESEKKTFKEAFSARFDIKSDTEEILSTPLIGFESSSRPRNLTKPGVFLRTMRNALAHARVEIQGTVWVFDNEDKHGSYDRAVIKITWQKLGLLCDATLVSYTQILYPSA